MPIRSCQALRLNSCGCSFTRGLASRAVLHRNSWCLSTVADHSGTRKRSLKSPISPLKCLVPQEKLWDFLLPPVLSCGPPHCPAGGDLEAQAQVATVWRSCLNFLYPAAAREPSSECCWLIDEKELSELQQCPRAWWRGWRPCCCPADHKWSVEWEG